jgi:hypothetical protein
MEDQKHRVDINNNNNNKNSSKDDEDENDTCSHLTYSLEDLRKKRQLRKLSVLKHGTNALKQDACRGSEAAADCEFPNSSSATVDLQLAHTTDAPQSWTEDCIEDADSISVQAVALKRRAGSIVPRKAGTTKLSRGKARQSMLDTMDDGGQVDIVDAHLYRTPTVSGMMFFCLLCCAANLRKVAFAIRNQRVLSLKVNPLLKNGCTMMGCPSYSCLSIMLFDRKVFVVLLLYLITFSFL